MFDPERVLHLEPFALEERQKLFGRVVGEQVFM